jgi:hypothetical protein
MVKEIPTTPFSNLQMELLNLYAVGVSDDTLLEIKKAISRVLMSKLRDEADQVWVEKGFGSSELNEWLGKNHAL